MALKKPLIKSTSSNGFVPLSYSPTHVSSTLVIPSSPRTFLVTRGNGGITFLAELTSIHSPFGPVVTPSSSAVLPSQFVATEYIKCINVSMCAIMIFVKFSTVGYQDMRLSIFLFSAFNLLSLFFSLSLLLASACKALILSVMEL